MRVLKVILCALWLVGVARAQQPQHPAFKPYAAREPSETITQVGASHAFGGKFSQLVEGGFARFREGRYAEALEHFKQAVDTPLSGIEIFNLRDAYYSLGVACEALGRREEAVAAYSQVAEVRTGSARRRDRDFMTGVFALYNLGNVYADSGQHREAVAAFKRVSEVLPEAFAPHYNMGLSYAALGETQNAVEAFARAVRLSPPGAEPEIKKLAAKLHYNLGASQAASKRYGAAAGAFKEAAGLAPEYAEAHYNLGAAYHLLGDRAGALRQLEILAKLRPQFAEELKLQIKN